MAETSNLGLEEFRSRLDDDSSRRSVGLRISQSAADELMLDDMKLRAAYLSFRSRTNQGNPNGGPVLRPATPPADKPKSRLTTKGWTLLVSLLSLVIGLTLLIDCGGAAASHTSTDRWDCSTTQFGAVRCDNSITTWISDGYSITMICLAVFGGLLALFGIAAYLSRNAAPAVKQ